MVASEAFTEMGWVSEPFFLPEGTHICKLTERRTGGHVTFFLHRNDATDSEWDGVWLLLVGYHVNELKSGAADLASASGAALGLIPHRPGP